MTIAEIKAELDKRGIDHKGCRLKAEFVQRLADAAIDELGARIVGAQAPPPAPAVAPKPPACWIPSWWQDKDTAPPDCGAGMVVRFGRRPSGVPPKGGRWVRAKTVPVWAKALEPKS